MPEKNQFHLSTGAAERYQRQKVPAIFAPMANATLNAVSIPTRADVLDVACGTGIVARAVAERIAEPSRIVGADLNSAMIEVARRETQMGPHRFEWIAAPAHSMPLDDASFDLAFCQQGLQFFPDKLSALKETRRVLHTGGRLVLTCWSAIPPFFSTVAGILDRHLGQAAAKTAIDPFVWNDAELMRGLLVDAGFDGSAPSSLPVVRTMSAAPEAMLEEILATPNEPALLAAGDATLNSIVTEILEGLAHFRNGETLTMPQQAHLFDAIAV